MTSLGRDHSEPPQLAAELAEARAVFVEALA
jgi:hypothetical protein